MEGEEVGCASNRVRINFSVDEDTKTALSSGEGNWELLAGEIWGEIMLRLPFKSLLACQLVCKTWNSIIASHQIFAQKLKLSSVLPMSGLLTRAFRGKAGIYRTYLPVRGLGGCIVDEVDEGCNGNDCIAKPIFFRFGTEMTPANAYHEGNEDEHHRRWFFLGGAKVKLNKELMKTLTIDFEVFTNLPSTRFSCHKGLILGDVERTRPPRYHVYNPVTKQKITLPTNPSSLQGEAADYGRLPSTGAFIINLSREKDDHHLCGFMVVRFLKEKHIVLIYYSHLRKWVSSPYTIHGSRDAWEEDWLLSDSVFLDGTLYILTCGRKRVVGVRFSDCSSESDSCAQHTLDIYSFAGPPTSWQTTCTDNRMGILGGVADAGLFYASHEVPRNVRVWKHSHKGGWIQLAHINRDWWFRNSCIGLSRDLKEPCADTFKPIAFHPDYPIVFLWEFHSILAYNFATHALQRIAKLDSRRKFFFTDVFPFSPCLAPLELEEEQPSI